MLKINNLILSIVFCLSSVAVSNAETLKDPKTRDEDLSHTTVTASYRILPDGMYEYSYDIESPPENIGIIDHFSLDLSCSDTFSATAFSEPPIRMFKDSSPDGKHVPAQADGVMYHTYSLGISVYNEMYWGIDLKPAQTAKGYRLVSPVGPGEIRYTLDTVLDSDGWDYGLYAEDDPTVPRAEDFTVTGMITGPACPSKMETFPGTNKHEKESEEVNNLLSYSAPLKDRFHVEKGTKEVEFTIHYADNIDPKTFKVKPGRFKSMFDPKPGTRQTVVLPLDKRHWRTRVKFEARAKIYTKDKKGPSFGGWKNVDKTGEGKHQNKHRSRSLSLERQKDVDVFEIRTEEYKKKKHGSRYKHHDDHKNKRDGHHE